jgi:hypothetical protein
MGFRHSFEVYTSSSFSSCNDNEVISHQVPQALFSISIPILKLNYSLDISLTNNINLLYKNILKCLAYLSIL